MEAMRDHWTDDRMDDLAGRMDAGFERVDAHLRALRSDVTEEMRALRMEMNTRFAAMEKRFDERFVASETQLSAMQRQLAQIGWAMVGMLGAAMIGLIATQL
jgi:roadblock/LC7 domain-containing protein